MFDTDEVAMPQKHKDWHEMLREIDREDRVSEDFDTITFRHVHFFGNTSSKGQGQRDLTSKLDVLRPHLRGSQLKMEQDMRARRVFGEGTSAA